MKKLGLINIRGNELWKLDGKRPFPNELQIHPVIESDQVIKGQIKPKYNVKSDILIEVKAVNLISSYMKKEYSKSTTSTLVLH